MECNLPLTSFTTVVDHPNIIVLRSQVFPWTDPYIEGFILYFKFPSYLAGQQFDSKNSLDHIVEGF